MSDGSDDPEQDIIHREFDPNDCTPKTDGVEVIAELKETEPAALSPLYTMIDDIISNIFGDPPAPEAQVEITFTYEGYRITIHQDGKAAFRKVS